MGALSQALLPAGAGPQPVFRRTFLTALRQAAAQEHLSMQGQCQRWQAPTVWRQVPDEPQQTEWVVYAKPRWLGHSWSCVT